MIWLEQHNVSGIYAGKIYAQYGSFSVEVMESNPYRLARESHLSDATVGNIFRRNTVPSLITLEAICAGFGITLSPFFAENEMVELTPELKKLFDNWVNLTVGQKQAVLSMLQAMQHD